MIKFILNGSFRSGTTMLWKMLKVSNPTAHVFSEPLHNELFVAIEREQVLRELGHGYSTTDEYMSLSDKFINQLRQCHPNIGTDVYTFQSDRVIKYFKLFDTLDKPAILQPNRLHFILADVSNEFKCPVAHVVRNPMDVFLSVMFSSPALKKFFTTLKIKPYLLRSFRNSNPYFLDEQSYFIWKYFGIRSGYNSVLDSYIRPKQYYLSRFIISWTVSNWYAVNEIKKVNGKVFRYEDVVRNRSELEKLAKFSGVSFVPDTVKLHKKSVRKNGKRDSALCSQLADQAGIGEKFRYLMDRFKYE